MCIVHGVWCWLVCFVWCTDDNKAPPEQGSSEALQLGLQLALQERDAALRHNLRTEEERTHVWEQYEEMRYERNRALASLENLTGKSSTFSDR